MRVSSKKNLEEKMPATRKAGMEKNEEDTVPSMK